MSRPLAVGGALALAVGAGLLFAFDPAQVDFFPRCLFHALTGLHCPGCGTTRALHALLHGRVDHAFASNALTMTLLPFVAWHAGSLALGLPRLPQLRSAVAIWGIFAAIVGFWVARNLPGWPFELLAPH